MLNLFSSLLFALLILPANSKPNQPSALADRVVATVGSAVVTQSDIRLHTALAELDPSFVPILQHREANQQQDAVDAAILRTIAGRVHVYQPKSNQIRSRVSRFRSLWSNSRDLTEFLALHGLEGERLPAALQRRMVIERVVHRNFGPPEENATEWSQRFTAWMERERETVRVRLIPPQDVQ
jgi:hypothetical protein